MISASTVTLGVGLITSIIGGTIKLVAQIVE